MSELTKVNVYTDGACSGNPGPGGWCAILVSMGMEKEISGGAHETTNNRMELTAVIEALKALKRRCSVHIVTDSKYVVDGVVKGWAKSWRAKGWKKSDGKPALNPELWGELLNLLDSHEVTFEWIKGHAGHEYNERCDKAAVMQTEKHRN